MRVLCIHCNNVLDFKNVKSFGEFFTKIVYCPVCGATPLDFFIFNDEVKSFFAVPDEYNLIDVIDVEGLKND